MEAKKHYKDLIEKLTEFAKDEKYFNDVNDILLDEINSLRRVNPDRKTNTFLHHLLLIQERELSHYLNVKRKQPKKNHDNEYSELVYNIQIDIRMHCDYDLND